MREELTKGNYLEPNYDQWGRLDGKINKMQNSKRDVKIHENVNLKRVDLAVFITSPICFKVKSTDKEKMAST